jgi:hypothetical protein
MNANFPLGGYLECVQMTQVGPPVVRKGSSNEDPASASPS